MGLLQQLIKFGYPESTAQKIASGELPMDYVSRMQRAKDQGFDLDVPEYTGSDNPITNINKDVWSSPNPNLAASYTRDAYTKQGVRNGYWDDSLNEEITGGSIHPLLLKRDGNVVFEGNGSHWSNLNGNGLRTSTVRNGARRNGVPSVQFKGILDPGAQVDEWGIDVAKSALQPNDVTVTLDPTKVRSQASAAFDPDMTHSDNILSGVNPIAAAIPAGLLAAYSNDSEASKAAQVRKLAQGILDEFDDGNDIRNQVAMQKNLMDMGIPKERVGKLSTDLLNSNPDNATETAEYYMMTDAGRDPDYVRNMFQRFIDDEDVKGVDKLFYQSLINDEDFINRWARRNAMGVYDNGVINQTPWNQLDRRYNDYLDEMMFPPPFKTLSVGVTPQQQMNDDVAYKMSEWGIDAQEDPRFDYGTILPFRKPKSIMYGDGVELAMPSLLRDIIKGAVTAPTAVGYGNDEAALRGLLEATM